MPIYIKAFWYPEGFTEEEVEKGKEELIEHLKEDIRPENVMFNIERDKDGNAIRIQAKLVTLDLEEIEDLQQQIDGISHTISKLKDKWISFNNIKED